MRKAFQIALDKIIREGWQLDDAVTYALALREVSGRKIQTTMNVMKKRGVGVFDRVFKSVPQHRHQLLDDDVVYGVDM